MALPGYREYIVSGSITLGIWRNVGGWQLFGYDGVNIYQNVGNSPGRQTVNWSLQNTYALGQGVTDFGVTIEAADDTAAITYLGVSWSASQASGERSATPGGEQTTVVVRP